MVSEDMYRRVYRLMKQRFEPPLIAAAVNLPLSTILNVINRLERKPELAGSESEGVPRPSAARDASTEMFLDVYYLTKSRYTIVQFVGHITAKSKDIFEQEAHKIKTSVWKSIALQLTDVTMLDETGIILLIDLCKDLQSRERYVPCSLPRRRLKPLSFNSSWKTICRSSERPMLSKKASRHLNPHRTPPVSNVVNDYFYPLMATSATNPSAPFIL